MERKRYNSVVPLGMREVVIAVLLFASGSAAQTTITGNVVDARTGEALPYCTVARMGSTHGTITNVDGAFRITVDAADSVRFSFVGYRTRILPASGLDEHVVRLSAAVVDLGEALIRPDDELYDRIIRVDKWIRQAPGVRTKLFFGMETYSQGLPVEMIHAYYNASTKGGELLDLGLKNGRIGVAAHEGRLFVNYNTTKAFALMDITAEESYFPISPLKHKQAKLLRKGFVVEQVSAAGDADGVDHLRIVPRRNNPRAFTVELWLEPGGDAVRAVELWCRNCPQHPFRPLFQHGSIDTVDLRFKQTWSSGAQPLPEVMQLDYRMAYSGPAAQETFTTHALMHAYDRTSPFTLPLFNYPGEIPDYRKIGWLPEDTAFWQRVQPPLPTAKQQSAMEFLKMNDLNAGTWYGELDNARNFFKPPYAIWSPERRIRLSELTGAETPEGRPGLDPKFTDLVAQFYLDLDTVNGQLLHRSFTVADGYHTAVPAERLPWTDCFYNIWFDLCELERRKLEADLSASGTSLSDAQSLYTEHSNALRRMTQRLLEETGHGTRCEALFYWNAVVKEATGIDNIVLLGM